MWMYRSRFDCCEHAFVASRGLQPYIYTNIYAVAAHVNIRMWLISSPSKWHAPLIGGRGHGNKCTR